MTTDSGSPSSSILDAALGYARAGWRVFPCSPVTKAPLPAADKDKAGNRIPNTGGIRKASTDPDQIRAWWAKWPKAMIGAVTGAGMDAFVVDFDVGIDAETGEVYTLDNRIAALEERLGCPLPETAMAITRNGGCHLYFALPVLPEGMRLGNRDKDLPFKINVRGDNTGYVIVPPSRMQEGTGYSWAPGRRYSEVGALPAPQVLVDLLMVPVDGAADAGAAAPASTPARRRPVEVAGVDETVRKFVIAAIEGECRAISVEPKGNRNNRLYEGAVALGSLVGAGAVSRAAVEAALLDVGLALEGADRGNVTGTVKRGLDWGEQHPRDLSDVEDRARQRAARRGSGGGSASSSLSPTAPRTPRPGGGLPSSQVGGASASGSDGGAGGDDETLDRECAFLPLTDLGNAERFRRRCGGDFLFVQEWGWLAWDGRRWSREKAAALASTAVYGVVRAILREAALVADSGVRGDDNPDGLDYLTNVKRGGRRLLFSETIAGWGRTSESASHLRCVTQLAQPWLTAQPSEFDRDPFRVNLLNGTLVLTPPGQGRPASARVVEARREDRITKISAVAHDVAARCDLYDRFLERVQPDPEMRRFLHCWAGYNLTGDISAQKLVFNYGHGANGKSTWVDIVAAVIGDYSTTVGIETFLDQGRGRKGGDATPDLAGLAGRRMVRTSEPEKGTKFADALIKLITGGEPIKVRELNKEFFEMQVTFKVTVSGNHKPSIGTDHGIWRRMQLVPWSVTIPEAERDDALMTKLKGELPGILNRLIAGALDWMTNGLPAPDEVVRATQEYQEQSDPLGRFIELCVRPSAGGRVQSSVLYGVFSAWTVWAGEKTWSQRGFSMAMEERGYRKKQSDTIKWLDIELVKSAADFVDPSTGKAVGGDGGGGDHPSDPGGYDDWDMP